MEYKELYFTLQIVILKDVLCRPCLLTTKGKKDIVVFRFILEYSS